MKRVAIVGCGGSGKSFVARTLGELLDAPVTHLDAIFYDSDWNELPLPAFEEKQRALMLAPTWVIDGNYHSTLPVRLHACDTVVFLDLPTITCLWGAIWRQVRGGPGQHRAQGRVQPVASWRSALHPHLSAEDAPQGPPADP